MTRAWFAGTIATLMLVSLGAVHYVARIPYSAPPAVVRSDLWGEAGERWGPDSRLPDFSFAGYAMGERPIPQVPVAANVRDFGAKGDGTSDDSVAIIAAIASVQRGAILVPAGIYRLSQVIHIDRPGIVLRGEGPARTVLRIPKSLGEVLGAAPRSRGGNGHWSFGGGFIWLSGAERGTRLADVVAPARRGDRRILLSSTRGITAGQSIVIAVDHTPDGAVLDHLHSRPVEAAPDLVRWARGRLVDFVTPVVSVEENAVEIARPLRVALEPAWRPRVFSHAPTVTEVGLEELSLEFPGRPYAGHLIEDGYNAVFLEGVEQFWIKNVDIIDADSGIVSDGISRFGSISGVRLTTNRRSTEITGHHGISFEGPNDMLVTQFRIETRFVHDLTVDSLSNGNVFSKGRGLALALDHHRGAPYENLFTDLDAGSGERMWDSGGPSSGWGPHSAARETFWNIRAYGRVDPVPDFPQLTVVGMTAVRRGRHVDHWVEPIEAAKLRPQDLHLAQLERRLKSRNRSPKP